MITWSAETAAVPSAKNLGTFMAAIHIEAASSISSVIHIASVFISLQSNGVLLTRVGRRSAAAGPTAGSAIATGDATTVRHADALDHLASALPIGEPSRTTFRDKVALRFGRTMA